LNIIKTTGILKKMNRKVESDTFVSAVKEVGTESYETVFSYSTYSTLRLKFLKVLWSFSAFKVNAGALYLQGLRSLSPLNGGGARLTAPLSGVGYRPATRKRAGIREGLAGFRLRPPRRESQNCRHTLKTGMNR
jgi:hypothetical protein